MRTQYPLPQQIADSWTQPARTPEQEVVFAAKVADEKAAILRYMACNRDTAFKQRVQELLVEQLPTVAFDNFMLLAGSQHGAYPGPYDIADTPEKMLKYWKEENPPSQQELEHAAKQQQKDFKRHSKETWKISYSAYLRECQERLQRHADAKMRHSARVKESFAILAQETADPAPVPPVKPL